MVEFFENDQEAFLVTRRCLGGDLQMYMEAREFRDLAESRIKQIARGIAAGIKFLHDKRIIHRDIKAENILLSNSEDSSNPLIADFGLATVLYDGQMATKRCGSRGSVAPEILQCQPYSFPVDIWSFGVLLYSLETGCLPFPELAGNLKRTNKVNISEIIRKGLKLDFVNH